MKEIPKDFPVQPLGPGATAKDPVTCGTCHLSWDDGLSTSMTPTPAGRCPFEAFHEVCEDCGEDVSNHASSPEPSENGKLPVMLSLEEIMIITEALDDHLYEGLATEDERDSGFVYFPEEGDGDFENGDEEDQSRWRLMAEVESLIDRLNEIAMRHSAAKQWSGATKPA